MIRRYLPKDAKQLAHWYMRYVSPLSLIAGFLADNLVLLRRVDVWTSNVLLLSYIIVAAVSIVIINMLNEGKLRAPWLIRASPLIPLAAQYAFGGLFSGYLSLYSRSAHLAISWIFILILAALLLGNERFVHFYERFAFQVSMFFTVLLSFLIFFLPVAFHRIGPDVFILSGLMSLLFITLFLILLNRLVPEVVRRDRLAVVRSIAVIYCLFNVLYFTNIIPPLPLSMREAGVYHSISRTPDGYVLSGEPLPWYEKYFRYNTVFHKTSGESVYVWSAIFAPTGLTTGIVHEWQHYDPITRNWVTYSSVRFPLLGGRDGGYRGYSFKSDPAVGAWRVNVLTQYGQIIGRVNFSVIESSSTSTLENTAQ